MKNLRKEMLENENNDLNILLIEKDIIIKKNESLIECLSSLIEAYLDFENKIEFNNKG
jgi:hypothetical protein